MKRKREIATGLMILAIATVFGQQTTPPPDQAKPDTKKDEQAETPAPVPEIPKLNVNIGWSQYGLSGNQNKFRQYATPAKGFFLSELSYAPTFGSRNDAFVDIKTPWQDDFRLDGTLRLNNGVTYLRASEQRNRFFSPDPSVLNGNERLVSQGSIRQKLTPDFGLSFTERMDQQDQNFPAPADPLHQKTRIWNAAAQGSLWKDGFVDLTYTDWRYWDRTQVLQDTNMQRWGAGLMQQFGDILNLHGSFARSEIHQPGVGTTPNTIDQWSVGGTAFLGEDTSLIGDVQNEKLTLPVVQSAYDRERDVARGRIVHSFGGGWSGQVGYNRLALERVNADHTFVDTPIWHTFDASVYGKLSPSVRLTARASRATMQGGAGMETDDPRALYWRNRFSGELKLDTTSELTQGYITFGIHDDSNDARGVRVRNQNLTVGGSFQAKPELEFYAEGSYDLWSGTTTDPLSPNLNQFFPDGTTFTIGMNWTIDERAFATANYTLFTTNNDNPLGLPGGNVRGNLLTTTFHYKTTLGYELGLTIAPWRYSDRLYQGLGYNTGLVQLTAKARF